MEPVIHTHTTKLGCVEYFFDYEVSSASPGRHYLRAFFRFPGILEPASAHARHPGWFRGTLLFPLEREHLNAKTARSGHYIQYINSSLRHKEDCELWEGHGVKSGGAININIESYPELEALYTKHYLSPVNDLDLQAIIDDRSRTYLEACVRDVGILEYRVEVDEDKFAKSVMDHPEWHVRYVRYGIDGEGYHSTRFAGPHNLESLAAIEGLARAMDRGPMITCWECGQTSHWLDSDPSGEGLSGYLRNLTESYCGC